MSGTHGHSSPGDVHGHGVLKEMWETRPSRPRQDRLIAGVAAGIARRYDIDPLLVRIGFVVAACYGIGAVLYLAGWVALPEESDDTPRSHPRPLLLAGLAAATLFSLGGAFREGGILLPTAVAVGLLVLLHVSRGRRDAADPASPSTGPHVTGFDASTPQDGADAGGTGAAEPTGGTAESATRTTPPSWDPLGVAPFAWDLPEPSPEPPPPAVRPPRSRTTAMTLAAALLAAGITSVVMLVAGTGVIPSVLFGVVLAVLGAGLVVGAFTRTGRGLVPIALALSVVTYVVVAAPPLDGWRGGTGDLRLAPATVGAVEPVYRHSMGELHLDLRGLDLTVPPGTPEDAAPPVRTSVQLGMGEARVLVPRDADVTVRAEVGLGRVVFEHEERAGMGPTITVVDDLGADGIRSGRAIELELEAGVGNVEVFRG